MIALALLLQVATAPVPPADWSALPDLPLPVVAGSADPSGFVQGEVLAGRCRAADAIHVDAAVAVLVGEDGTVSRVVPRAIDCPTVEQYTAGYVSTLARKLEGLKPGWYRYLITYRWGG